METNNKFRNTLGVPDELISLLTESYVCEYASIARDGTPITSPLIPNPGKDGATIDVNTGLTYPWKAERARKNPHVCLLYSEPKGLRAENAPVVLVYGHAAVRDADLQGNTDRYVQVVRANSKLFGRLPLSLLGLMVGYIARIWISILPLRILWWPEGQMQQTPKEWTAPDGISLPVSDPPPEPLEHSHSPLESRSIKWQETMAYAIARLGKPVLTVVDENGFPAPVRTKGGQFNADSLRLDLPSSIPVRSNGRACLTFHNLQIRNGEMYSNENYSFVGEFVGNGSSGLFKIERQLPSANFKRGLGDMIALGKMMMRMRERLKTEAARRGQPVPVVRLVN